MLLKNTWRGISRRMGNTKAETITKTCQSTFPVSEFTGVVVDSPGFDVTLGIGEMDEPVFIQPGFPFLPSWHEQGSRSTGRHGRLGPRSAH